MRDMKSNGDAVVSLVPAVRTESANGVTVDLRGFRGAVVEFISGAIVSSGNQTPKVQESDNDSDWSDVDAADMIGSLAVLSASAVQRVGYVGNMRYIRAVITHNSGTSVATAAMVQRGMPDQRPV